MTATQITTARQIAARYPHLYANVNEVLVEADAIGAQVIADDAALSLAPEGHDDKRDAMTVGLREIVTILQCVCR